MIKGSFSTKKNEEGPICKACKYFFITYEPRHPYGCRAFGFKGRLYPCLLVKRASNDKCRLFSKKERKERKA